MKPHFLILALLVIVTSCNEVNDLRPADPGAVPDAAVQVVKARFPQATDLTLKTLVDKSVWEARFRVNADQYTSLVNKTEMFETFRSAPDSMTRLLPELMKVTSFRGGTFSGNTEDVAYDAHPQQRHRLQYQFNGNNYLFEWMYYRGSNYKPSISFFETLRYKVLFQDQHALPDKITDYLAAHKDLTFQSFEAWIGLNDEKLYKVRVLFKTSWGKDELGDLLLTETGELKWTSREFNAPQVYTPESNIGTLPEPISNVLAQSPELAGFQFRTPAQERWRSEYDGISSYYLNLINKDGAEVCTLYFDADGALLYKRYFVSF